MPSRSTNFSLPIALPIYSPCLAVSEWIVKAVERRSTSTDAHRSTADGLGDFRLGENWRQMSDSAERKEAPSSSLRAFELLLDGGGGGT